MNCVRSAVWSSRADTFESRLGTVPLRCIRSWSFHILMTWLLLVESSKFTPKDLVSSTILPLIRLAFNW
jgi:hypothetical protein